VNTACRVHDAICETCRVLISRGTVGLRDLEGRIEYPSMSGDIALTAELTVHATDHGEVHFAKWRPLDQDAISRFAVPAPARETNEGGRRVAAQTTASLRSDRESTPEAAE
jgi:hypothetical protein